MHRRNGWVLLGCLFLAAQLPVLGVAVKSWSVSTADGFAPMSINVSSIPWIIKAMSKIPRP